jgi:hypothetical protein
MVMTVRVTLGPAELVQAITAEKADQGTIESVVVRSCNLKPEAVITYRAPLVERVQETLGETAIRDIVVRYLSQNGYEFESVPECSTSSRLRDGEDVKFTVVARSIPKQEASG